MMNEYMNINLLLTMMPKSILFLNEGKQNNIDSPNIEITR